MATNRGNESEELSRIFSKLVAADSCSEVGVFKEKYQVFLLENMFVFPKPLGDLFKKGIIMCGCKEMRKKSSSKHSSGSFETPDASSFVSELDVTGSPLECIFDSILLEEGSPRIHSGILKSPRTASSVCPLPLPDAMYILDLCNLCPMDALKKVPLFVLCDGRDPQQTILLGVCRMEKNSRLRFTCKGPFSKRDEFPTLQDMNKFHQKSYNSTLETSAYAHYDIVDHQVSASTLKPCKEGALAIKCTWTNVSSLFQMPTADATCELLVPSVPGDDHSGAYTRYRELKLVQALATSLRSGRVAWTNTEPNEKLYVKLMDLIAGKHDSDVQKKTQQNELPANSLDFESSFEATVTKIRKDMDFTDQLWTILTECTCYTDLTYALDFIFHELKNSSISPPVVCRKNTTAVAELVRNMHKESIPCPSLESTKPIELLLEMGVDKLQKDYLTIFVGLELCPYDSIVPYLQENKLSDEAVNCLAKLHAILELTVLCWTHLSLPKMILNSVVRSALKHYTFVPTVDPTYIFKFPISMLHVKTAIEKLEPTAWQASFFSSCDEYDEQTVLHLSTQPFLQFEPFKKIQRVTGSPSIMRNSYYCTNAHFVADCFPVTPQN